jgi:3-hydroxyacyl-CoA dehydrogenase / 3-hydroxy-2-methylbutyryl-CoA dehydrogenase
MNIEGSVTLVTGGASGVGRGVAGALVERGGRVLLLDLPTSPGPQVATALGSSARFVPVDVSDAGSVETAVATSAATFGRLDCVVCCAGILQAQRIVNRDGGLHALDAFRRHLEVNLLGTFDVIRHSVAAMRGNEPRADGERGLVVTIASIAAFEGQVGQIAYAASKGGVAAMTLPAARELGPLGIRVVCICPGTMDTPMLGALDEEVRAGFAEQNAFPKRLGTPNDVAGMVMAAMENVFLNGETIRLDAGLRMAPR